MKKHLILAVVFMFFLMCTALSQTPTTAAAASAPAPADTTWKNLLVAHLNLTQVSFTNWAQGGENSLSYGIGAEGASTMNDSTVNWDNEYKFAFGQARLSDQGLRKTDDKIDLASVLTYKVDSWINPYASATLKTQFAKGYTYDDTGHATLVSNFFDPGYLQQSVGAGFQPMKEVKIRFGTGLREIFAADFTNYANGQKSSVDGGLEMVTDVHWEIDTNILFTSKIELFDPYKSLGVVVVHSDNTINCRVSKYIQVTLNVQIVNEKDVTPETQYAQTLGMGLTYSIF